MTSGYKYCPHTIPVVARRTRSSIFLHLRDEPNDTDQPDLDDGTEDAKDEPLFYMEEFEYFVLDAMSRSYFGKSTTPMRALARLERSH